MIRFLVTYDDPVDPEKFDRHYTSIHEPLARSIPGLISYTVHRQPRAVRGAGFYQVAELTWPDWESARAAFASPEGRAAAADMAEVDAPVRSCLYELPD